MSRTLSLDEARTTGAVVTIHRRTLGPDTGLLDGVVLATGVWTLVGSLADWAHADGYEVIRTEDVTKVRRLRRANQRFVERAAAGLGSWPLPRPDLAVDLTSVEDVVRSVARTSRLLAVHAEAESPGEYFPGAVGILTDEGLGLRFIDTAGRWEAAPRWFGLGEITRVSWGSRYLGAFDRFGDRPPFAPFVPSDG
ncbi:hypothetical protein ASE27_07120 [Oerskovia sp. Root918]|uniref:hypothetical protein n=1 Tax=Oerskovia sp. Root918 TaxID=1736607 RepID=UPI0006F85B9C|nr:hypothetical protein [Oerskovia sp. Root918]KRD37195.1 hypothetical protein ASE27_07120 [Oerskovia sp. Root918]